MSLLLLLGSPSGVGTGCTAITTTGASGVPVVVGREYMAVADALTAVTSRTVGIGIRWYTSGGVLISSTTGSTAKDNTSTWVQLTCPAIAPATAAFASVYVEVVGASAAEVHYFDRIGLMEPSLWSLPE